VAALGVEKDNLKFDYRLGIAGSVFTTGVALNIDTSEPNTRFNIDFDKKLAFETKSIVCHPIHNREDKIIGADIRIKVQQIWRSSTNEEFDQIGGKIIAVDLPKELENLVNYCDKRAKQRYQFDLDWQYEP